MKIKKHPQVQEIFTWSCTETYNARHPLIVLDKIVFQRVGRVDCRMSVYVHARNMEQYDSDENVRRQIGDIREHFEECVREGLVVCISGGINTNPHQATILSYILKNGEGFLETSFSLCDRIFALLKLSERPLPPQISVERSVMVADRVWRGDSLVPTIVPIPENVWLSRIADDIISGSRRRPLG